MRFTVISSPLSDEPSSPSSKSEFRLRRTSKSTGTSDHGGPSAWNLQVENFLQLAIRGSVAHLQVLGAVEAERHVLGLALPEEHQVLHLRSQAPMNRETHQARKTSVRNRIRAPMKLNYPTHQRLERGER